MTVRKLSNLYASIGHGELTENDVVCLSNYATMKKTTGNRRLRFMLETSINMCGTKKEILSRILRDTQRLSPPMRFLRYDVGTRKYLLMDAKDALTFINSELKSLQNRQQHGAAEVPTLKSTTGRTLLESGRKAEQKVCVSEEARETTIANLLIGIKGSQPLRPQRQERKAHSENNPIMANRDQSDIMVDGKFCGGNKDAANESQQTQTNLNCNSPGGTIDEPNDMDIIFSTSGNASLTNGALQLFRRVLEEIMKDSPTTGKKMELVSRMYSRFQKLDPPMRFLRCNDDGRGYSICDSDFAMHQIEKCFDGKLKKQRLQKEKKTKLMPDSSIFSLGQPKRTSLGANQTMLPLRPAFPDPNQVQVPTMNPNQSNEPVLQAIAIPKQSQVEMRAAVPPPTSNLSPLVSKAPNASFNTRKNYHRPFIANLPTPQIIQAAYSNPTRTNQPLLQVIHWPTTETPQFGSTIGEEDVNMPGSISNGKYDDPSVNWSHSPDQKPLVSFH